MSECVAPSRGRWREVTPTWDDEYATMELTRAWASDYAIWDPSDHYGWHDWCDFRAATLREARKRGLDISIARIGT